MGMLDRATKAVPDLPPRSVLYSPEGMGKTSFGCFAPNPFFIMTQRETGLVTLIQSGEVPPTAHMPPDDTSTWTGLTSAVQALTVEKHDYRTLFLDTANGAEQMLTSHVAAAHFKGDLDDFNSYGKGLAICVPMWGDFLASLDRLRAARGMEIVLLQHARVKTFSNPAGKDWDQWKPECVDKLWTLTHKWADLIAFYGIKVKVSAAEKAYGDEQRYLRFTPSAQITAKNRYGLPDEIFVGNTPKAVWNDFAANVARAKAKGVAASNHLFDEAAKTLSECADIARLSKVWTLVYKDKDRFTAEQFSKLEAIKDELKAKFAPAAQAPASPPPATETVSPPPAAATESPPVVSPPAAAPVPPPADEVKPILEACHDCKMSFPEALAFFSIELDFRGDTANTHVRELSSEQRRGLLELLRKKAASSRRRTKAPEPAAV